MELITALFLWGGIIAMLVGFGALVSFLVMRTVTD